MRRLLAFLPAFMQPQNTPRARTESRAVAGAAEPGGGWVGNVCDWREGTPVDSGIRTELLTNGFSRVTAYPSVGGIVLADVTAVQLRQLGLPNLEETRRPTDLPAGSSREEEEEDALALALMRQGGRWWPGLSFYERHWEEVQKPSTIYDFHFPPSISVAYPSWSGEEGGGGVWVLKASDDNSYEPYDDEPALPDDDENPYVIPLPFMPRKPRDLHHTTFALSPDERCKVLQRLGAVYFADAGNCSDLPKTLEEGYQTGRRYETLLRRLDDPEYQDKWYIWGGTQRNEALLARRDDDDYEDRWFKWLAANSTTE